MDDMNAFERLVSAEVQVEAGPSRPTDVAAVIRSAATKPPRWRFQTMFSATKYLVAGVIVALFGGLLLTGTLPTGQQSPQAPGAVATPLESPEGTIRADILPDYLYVEEYEDGVYRVESDGLRTFQREIEQQDLSDHQGFFEMVSSATSERVVAGLDGSLWHVSGDQLYRLGEPESYDWGVEPGPWSMSDVEVGLDGRVWQVIPWTVNGQGWLRSFDGEQWTVQKRIRATPENNRADGKVFGVEIASNGQVWAAWVNDKLQGKVGRLEGDEWVAYGLPGRNPFVRPDLFAHDGDKLLIANGTETRELLQLNGDLGSFESVDRPDGALMRLDVGPESTAWIATRPSPGPDRVIARKQVADWSTFDTSMGIPVPGHHFMGIEGIFEVGHDGSLWFDPIDFDGNAWGCNGIVNFDGTTVRHYLQDLCFYGGDIGPDGTAWVFAGEWGGLPDENGYPTEPEAGPVQLFAIPPAST